MSIPQNIRPAATTDSFEDLSRSTLEGRQGRELSTTGTLPLAPELPDPNEQTKPSFLLQVNEAATEASKFFEIAELPNVQSFSFQISLESWNKYGIKIAKFEGLIKINQNFINSTSGNLSFTILTDSSFSAKNFSDKFSIQLTLNSEQLVYRVQVGEVELVFPLTSKNPNTANQSNIENRHSSQNLDTESPKPAYFGSYLQVKLPQVSSLEELTAILQSIDLLELTKNKKLAILQDSEFNLVITNNAERGIIDLLILAQEIVSKCPFASIFINENTGSNINPSKFATSAIYIPRKIQEDIQANRRLNYLVNFDVGIPDESDNENIIDEIYRIHYKPRVRKAIVMSGTEFQDLISRFKNIVDINEKIVNFVGKAGSGKTETILNILQELEDSGILVEFENKFYKPKHVIIYTNFRDKNSTSLGSGVADIFEQARAMLSKRYEEISQKYDLTEDHKQIIQNFLNLSEQEIYQLAKKEPGRLLNILTNIINLFKKIDILGGYYLVIEDLHFADITSAQLISKFIKEIHSPNLRVITSSRYNHEFENLEVAFALEKIKDDKKTVVNGEIPTLNLVQFNPVTQEIIPNRVQMHKFLTNFIKSELQPLLKLHYQDFDYYSFSVLLGLAEGNPETMQRLLRLVAEEKGFHIISNSELSIKDEVLERITSLRTDTNSDNNLNATIDINRIQNNQVFKSEHRITTFIIGLLGEKDHSLIKQIASSVLQEPEDKVQNVLETLLDSGYIKLDQRNNTTKIQLNSLDLKLHLSELIPAGQLLQICQSILAKFRQLLDQETIVYIQTIIIKNTPQALYLHAELEAIPDIYDLFKSENHSIYSIKHAENRLAILNNLRSLDQRTSLYSSGINPSLDLKLDYLVQQKILAELSIAALSRQSEDLIQLSRKYEPILETPYLKDIKSDFYSLIVFGLAIIRQTNSESKKNAFNEMLKFLNRLKTENQTELYNLGLVHTLLQLDKAKIPYELIQLDPNLRSIVSDDPDCQSIKAGYFIGIKFLNENKKTDSPLKLELERLINRISYERDRSIIEEKSELDTRELYTFYQIPEELIVNSQSRIQLLLKYIKQYQDSPNSLLENGILPVLDQLRDELLINLPRSDDHEIQLKLLLLLKFCQSSIDPFALNSNDPDASARNARIIAMLTVIQNNYLNSEKINEIFKQIETSIRLFSPDSKSTEKEVLTLDKICFFAIYLNNLNLKTITVEEILHILDLFEEILNSIDTILEHFNYDYGASLSAVDIIDWGSIGYIIEYLSHLIIENPFQILRRTSVHEQVQENSMQAYLYTKTKNLDSKAQSILDQLLVYLDEEKVKTTIRTLEDKYKKSPLRISSTNLKGLKYLLQQINLTNQLDQA